MYEKILSLLTTKFSQARKDGLQQLARTIALQVETEEEGQALVEKFTDDKVTAFIRDYRKEVDSEVTSSTKKYESNLKSKYDFVEKKTPTPMSNPTEPQELSTIIANAISQAINPLQVELTELKAGKLSGSRKEELSKLLADAPTSFKAPILKAFDKIKFDSDEDFDKFKNDTLNDFKAFEQELSDKGLSTFITPANPNGNVAKMKVSKDIEDWAKQNIPTKS